MEIKQIPSKEVLGFLDSAEEKPYSLLDERDAIAQWYINQK